MWYSSCRRQFQPACVESRMRPDPDQDRADVEQVFNKYLQSLDAADVALALKAWLQSPDVLVVTPLGRFKGWDGVQEIYAKTLEEYPERKVQASNVSIVVAGDTAWLVYAFMFYARGGGERP